jgi:hypothetical protein
MLYRLLPLPLALVACTAPDSDDVVTPAEPTGPIAVTGFGDDTLIAENAGDSEAEPSVVALPDGTVVAAWMNLDRYQLYIKYARSTDGGLTWSDADFIDEDRWGYQNDPELVQGGGYIYFTWLAVEGSNYDKSSIYCKDSTDGGVTWSDSVKLTTAGTFNDRQWMAADADGRAVITWDYFENNYYTQQAYSETAGGCAGFADYDIIAQGSFLNGVPAIDNDGRVWTSRAEYDYSRGDMDVVVSTEDDGDWDDTILLKSAASPGAAVAIAEDPAEEREEKIESIEEAEEGDGGFVTPLSGGMDLALRLSGSYTPRRLASGNFDGFYSPVLQPLSTGGIGVATLSFEDGSDSVPDVYFLTYVDGEKTEMVLNQDEPGNEQMEPWMAVDAWGGLHVSWFDAREGHWRLYGATSLDGGASFEEYTIGDDTFRKGFDDSDAYAWVGHFQGLTTSDDNVIAVWGDSRDGDVSKLMADTSVGR